MEELASGPVDPLVSVCTKVITLGLEQVRRQARRPVAVVIGECGTDGRHGDAQHRGHGDHTAPGTLCLTNGCFEEIVNQQIAQVRILLESIANVSEEAGANDASAAPHEGNSAEIQIPVLLL